MNRMENQLTGTVDHFERSGASSGQFESGFVDAETVARQGIALNRLEIANRIAIGQCDVIFRQLQSSGPFHRLNSLAFTGWKKRNLKLENFLITNKST